MRMLILSFFLLSLPLAAFADTSLVADHAISAEEITLKDGRSVRLNGLFCTKLGEQDICSTARDTLQKLVAGQVITMENVTTDRYGRLMADVSVTTDKGEKIDVQNAMLQKGMAFLYPPVGDELHLDVWLKTEATARKDHRGLWAGSSFTDTTADQAEKQIGHFAFVHGKVLKAARIKNMVYLNFGNDWKSDFTIAIAAHDLHAFRAAQIDPLAYQDKNMRVRGWVKRLFGPMISVTDPHQIEILDTR